MQPTWWRRTRTTQRLRYKDGSHLPPEALPSSVLGGGLRNQLRKDGVLLTGHVRMPEHSGDAKVNLTHGDDDCVATASTGA